MNNEIKEIDITKDLYLCSPLLNKKCSKTSCYINNGSCCHTVNKEYSQEHLLDYITNLQQELETRQYDINNLTYQLAKEKEENAELKEYLKTMEKGKDNNLNRFLNYKLRIEKAIPMLKKLNIKLKGILNTGIDIKEISDIEDTLNGRSDE